MLFSHFIEGDTQPFVSSLTLLYIRAANRSGYSACVMIVRSGFLLIQHRVFLLQWLTVP